MDNDKPALFYIYRRDFCEGQITKYGDREVILSFVYRIIFYTK